jgi:hypothetical protein
MSRDGRLKKSYALQTYFLLQAIIKHFKDTEFLSIFFQLNFFHLLQVNF